MEAIKQQIPAAELERMMKLQEVILKAMSGKLTWIAAAEIIGVTDRTMRRWRERWQKHGYSGLWDCRKKRPSPKRVPVEQLQQVLQLYREQYFDFNVRHFHEKLGEVHGIDFSYTWVKTALQEAGLVKKRKKPGSHRKRRPRRPLPGMMLHIDGSKHGWFGDQRQYELIVVLDDATSEIYYAQLVEAESTRTIMLALREVIESKGVFCSLYSDRAGHFFVTPKRGERVDQTRPTQVGRALHELGIRMIPAYSPRPRTNGTKLPNLAGLCRRNCCRYAVAERLRHLLVLDEEVLDVHPEPRERLFRRAFRLRDLVLVMRKDQVDAAGMDVDRRLAQQPQRHRRALDVPARTAGAGADIPRRLPVLRRLPQHEIAGIVFRVFVDVDAGAGMQAIVIEARELVRSSGSEAILK